MFPDAVHRLAHLFTDHEIRVIGGWVRDNLRGVAPKDLDLATTALPQDVISLCKASGINYADTGLKHGTVGVILDHTLFEITTLRIDRETDGRHAEVEFTTDWRQDAERRDFTINAMSMGLDGTLFDYFDGRTHLDNQRIIFVGDAVARIREDYLRILRYFRFCGRIGDLHGHHDFHYAIKQNAPGLRRISGERIWMEMAKILSGDHVERMLTLMWWTRVFDHIGLTMVEPRDIYRAANVRLATTNPITILAALTPNGTITETWGMSRDERYMLHWLQANRDRRPTLVELKDIATSAIGPRAVEYAALFGPSAMLDEIRAWTPPVLPIQGRDLITIGLCPGPAMGLTIRLLERRWKESDYRLTKDQLLASLYAED